MLPRDEQKTHHPQWNLRGGGGGEREADPSGEEGSRLLQGGGLTQEEVDLLGFKYKFDPLRPKGGARQVGPRCLLTGLACRTMRHPIFSPPSFIVPTFSNRQPAMMRKRDEEKHDDCVVCLQPYREGETVQVNTPTALLLQ